MNATGSKLGGALRRLAQKRITPFILHLALQFIIEFVGEITFFM